MSHRSAASRSSGRIQHPPIRQDVVTPKGILEAALLNHIDFTPEYLAELVPHIDPGLQCGGGAFLENQQDVDVTVWAEVPSEDRAEDRELTDSPFAAKLGDAVRGDRNC